MARIELVRRFMQVGIARVFPGVARSLEQRKIIAEQEGQFLEAKRLESQLADQVEYADEALERVTKVWADLFSDAEIEELTRIFSLPVMQKFYSSDTVAQMLNRASQHPDEEKPKLNS